MNKLKNRRVVVTGLGAVSSIGIGWKDFWKNCFAGKSGISKVEAFDTSEYDRHYAGEIKDFDPVKFIHKKRLNHMGRTSQLTLSASLLALKDAQIDVANIVSLKSGVCVGTTMGEPQVMEELDARCFPHKNFDVDVYSALTYPASAIATNVAQYLKLKGQNSVFSNACAAGNYAIGLSYDLIRSGKMDFMLAGGADALSRIAFTGFGRLFAMSPDKCSPFDKERKGMMLGEGAGILLLEELEHAQKRKAPIYAEILGYGLSCDAHHMTAPKIKGVVKGIKKAIIDAGIKREDIDYISAHGTGTKENDKAECAALKDVFGEALKNIPVSSIKSMLGHTMGAAAALEAIVCCLAIKDGKIPPTINYKHKDPECDIDCVPNKARKRKVEVALNNSQAFGGNNACVVFKKL